MSFGFYASTVNMDPCLESKLRVAYLGNENILYIIATKIKSHENQKAFNQTKLKEEKIIH